MGMRREDLLTQVQPAEAFAPVIDESPSLLLSSMLEECRDLIALLLSHQMGFTIEAVTRHLPSAPQSTDTVFWLIFLILPTSLSPRRPLKETFCPM